jgi:uncharacterized protein (DUF111 family)
VALGNGTAETAHGMMPVPAPAVALMVSGLPTEPVPDDGQSLGELTTPTGAALLASFADEFGPAPAGRVVAVGHGAGTREVPGRPNVLRAVLIEPAPGQEDSMDEKQSSGGPDESSDLARLTATGVAGGVRRERSPEPSDRQRDADAPEPRPAEGVPKPQATVAADEPGPSEAAAEAEPAAGWPEPAPPDEASADETPITDGPVALDHVVLETNIDDMGPELLAHAADALREAGATDVWLSPATMKKGRPGVVLHVLCEDADRQRLAEVLFRETSTFGVRVLPVGRIYADERRESVTIGKLKVAVRLGFVDGRLVTVSPEYEDVRRVAAAVGRPAKVVYEAAQAAARARFSAS